jgi:hypothetical protein
MYDPDIEKLLEQNLAGHRASEAFRERVLRHSAAALGRGHAAPAWRYAACVAAAVVIAATSFLWGRVSASRNVATNVASSTGLGNPSETVSVPVELVAWLEAARFFKQLDMPERVALAYERAGKLVPHEALEADSGSRAALAAETRKTHTILAQSFGGYKHASE